MPATMTHQVLVPARVRDRGRLRLAKETWAGPAGWDRPVSRPGRDRGAARQAAGCKASEQHSDHTRPRARLRFASRSPACDRPSRRTIGQVTGSQDACDIPRCVSVVSARRCIGLSSAPVTATTSPVRAVTRSTVHARRRWSWIIWPPVLVAATVAQLYRQTGVPPWRTIWAEDGGTFFTGTAHLSRLLDPHAGYVEVIPRAFGLAGHLVPIQDLAWYYAIAGAVLTTLCAAAVWRFSRQIVPSTVLRGVLALSVVLAPTMILEQLGNGVNSIWAVAFAAWWAILYRPDSSTDAAAPAAVVFLAVLSQALTLAYAPVVAYNAWKRRERPTLLVAAAFLAGALVQMVVIAGATDDTPQGVHHFTDLPEIYGVRVLGSMLVSERGLGDVWDALGDALPALAALVAIGALVLLFRFAAARRGIAAVTVLYSAALYAVSLWGRGTVGMRVGAVYHSTGNRYASLSIWLLLSGLCILAANAGARARDVAVVVIAGQFAIVAFLGFRGANPRSDASTWTETLHTAAARCERTRSTTVTVFVVPPSPAFAIPVSCADLRR